ncbi:type 1 glutamine amidotransferase family protein [Companilactobacillus nuruki]|uniref:Glutamine amidotransferase n=1 Tax=Companilactobacillus nuruki TaxID=1993540 RepID=A0A2N7ASW8_9LACO|nr:type 1 glutamine amidotransferase family protein [Companilactobacillus nuruki]PMD68781.1 glutamine amidotransferase [Companilactobacillus nuruki]
MTKQAIFFVENEYADWEGSYLASQLNQTKDWKTKTASTQRTVKSIGGFTTTVDYLIKDLPDNIDLLILIGGNSWNLENSSLVALIQKRLDNNQPTAAICGAVDFLARNSLLNNYKHTGNSQALWQSYTNYTNPNDFAEQQVVIDRNLITANGTATLSFTNQVLKLIMNDSPREIDKITDLYRLGFYDYCKKYGNPFE